MKPYVDGDYHGAKLTCAACGERPALTFEEMATGSILVTLGEWKAVVTREEIAAVAALFPAVVKRIEVR